MADQIDKLDELLLGAGITAAQLNTAKSRAEKEKISLMHAIELADILPEEKLLQVFAQYFGVQITHLEDMEIPTSIINLIPAEIAEKVRAIPIDRAGNNIIVACGNPKNSQASYSIRFSTGYNVTAVLASEKKIDDALEKYYSAKKTPASPSKIRDNDSGAGANAQKNPMARSTLSSSSSSAQNQNPQNQRFDIGKRANNQDGPIIKLVNDVLQQCAERRASDIHIEPYETFVRIRLRIDGTLTELMKPPADVKDALCSRIKIMAGLDISEKRLSQDGGIRVTYNDRPIDFRVSTLPTIYGEKIVLRLLDKSTLQVDMTALGFEPQDLERFMQAIHQPHGMVLVTGPTGSGKTTTLYSALSELNKITDNITTAEDPVEYNIEGINQVQIKPDIGLDFAAALRSFLRQDPDIIMVGEIRDLVTAEIAIKAALTGHLVLSTLHTNSAPETIIRIRNMGVESFNIASSLNCVVAQRLTKKICEKCRVIDESVTPEILVNLGINPQYASRLHGYKGAGCQHCNFQGTRGRIAIHEVLTMTDEIREAVIANKSAIEIRKIAIQNNMKTLRQAAINKMVQGIISIQEVAAVSADEAIEETKEAAA